MMGSRGLRGAGEIDALSRGSRRVMRFGRGMIKFYKQRFWKRRRNIARREAGAWITGAGNNERPGTS